MTDEAKALVERLREKIADTLLAGLPYNRDGGEAADLIETQARELAKWKALAETLAGALQGISEFGGRHTGHGYSCHLLARAALETKP